MSIIRLALTDKQSLTDGKYHSIIEHLAASGCEFVGSEEAHDLILVFGDQSPEGDNGLDSRSSDTHCAPRIILRHNNDADLPLATMLHLFVDDGLQRVQSVLQSALQQGGTQSARNSSGSAVHVPAKLIEKLAITNGSAQFAMLISLGQLPLMNSRHGRNNVDMLLSALRQKLLLFAADSLDHSVALDRTADGFLLVANDLVERAKWQWMADEIVTMVRDSSLGDDSNFMLSANIALAMRRQDETAHQFVKRLAAGVEHAQSDASTHVKWADRGSDLAQIFSASLEDDLAVAIENGDVVIRFQPQFSIASGHLTGAEALARWEHPAMGELGASILFNVAERAGLMQPLSEYIQFEALQQAAKWPAALSDLRLSINLTAHDFAAPDFGARFDALLAKSGFSPYCLTIEITETDLISNLDRASLLCSALREQGMRVAIDDFGTGFSSLLYLKSLPLDYLKLDGAMSADIDGSPRDRVIVRSVVALALALNLELVAEGVETIEQRDLLGQEGCQYYQGYLGGRAMVPKDFIAFAMRAD